MSNWRLVNTKTGYSIFRKKHSSMNVELHCSKCDVKLSWEIGFHFKNIHKPMTKKLLHIVLLCNKCFEALWFNGEKSEEEGMSEALPSPSCPTCPWR